MGILFSEVVYNVSEERDFTDATANGMGIGTEIANDTLHSIFPEITASEREAGLTRRAKYFVSNKSSSRNMKDCIFYIKQDVVPPDRLKMYEATENASLKAEITNDLQGSQSAVAAGTSVAISNLIPDTISTSDFVGRELTIDSVVYTVASAPDASNITLNEDITVDIAAGTAFATSDDFDYHESDDDFGSSKPYINSVTRSTIIQGTTDVHISKTDSSYFEVGDNVVIVDAYYRALYRGTISDSQDDGSDNTLTILTLDKAFGSAISIPVNEGFICNGVKRDLKPGETKSMWLEVTIDASSAIDAEIINQFQLGTHFDDVTA